MARTRKRWPKGTWMRLKSGLMLRGLMDSQGVSNAEVAIAAGCGRTFISALVNERRTSCKVETADRIAVFLRVPVELLFDPRGSAVSGHDDSRLRKVPA